VYLLAWIIKCWNVSDLQTLSESWDPATLVANFGMNASGEIILYEVSLNGMTTAGS
jgi:hypothetical protein